jgi:hypothetical protein
MAARILAASHFQVHGCTGARVRGCAGAIGNAVTGELKYLIPDPGDLSKMTDTGTSASSRKTSKAASTPRTPAKTICGNTSRSGNRSA